MAVIEATSIAHAPTPMLLAGTWTARGALMDVRDPEDGRIIGSVPRASSYQAKQALDSAWGARAIARAMPPHERAIVLTKAAALVEATAEDFARTICAEGIKTIREARRETARCVETLRLSAEAARQIGGETIPFGQRPGGEHKVGFIMREPVGIVVAITPFNDPLNLVAHKIGPAIAAGNAVILKPHERTPLSALALARAFETAGLRDGILQVLTGEGAEVGGALVADQRVRMVSFTGGRVAGESIARIAGIKRLALELGGNCSTIVMADADLDHAVAASVSGAFWAAGQNCLHVQRILIQRNAYAAFRERFLERASAYRLGRKADEATDMGCLITEQAAQRVGDAVRSAVDCGAIALAGGDRSGTSMAVTVLEGVPAGHTLARDEVFGPVTLLAPFRDLDEGVAAANAPDYGLQAAIFTRDLGTALNAVHRLEAGAVIVNDSTDFRLDSMPFGGIKGSGIGREGVGWAVQEMTEQKVACLAW